MVNRIWIYTAVYVGSLFAASLYFQNHERVAVKEADKAAVTRTETKLVAQYAKNLAVAEAKFKQTTADMQVAADKQKVTKDEAIASINVKLVDALRELRNRPNRPAPGTPEAAVDPVRGASCDATKLYYEDAEFLTREAARAESVLLERNYYYSRYQTVKDQLNRGSE